MNIIRILLLILFFLFPLQKDPNYNKSGRPSTYGINEYVKKCQDNVVMEYTFKIDSLFYVDVFTDDLSQYSDENELGVFFPGDNIIVLTNQERYIEYEYNNLSKFKQKTTPYTERTVKAVLFHELTHAYFFQTISLMKMNNEYVSPEYGYLRIFPESTLRFGSEFIEEGVCEYVVYYLKESSPLTNVVIPKTPEELVNTDNEIYSKYYYSVYFLQDFLDEYGIEQGIKILVSNRPPSYQEILNPKLFYDRLEYLLE